MKSYIEFKNKLLRKTGTKAEYEKNKPEFDLVSKMIEKRIKAGLTQSDVAELLGTKQAVISRLESGEHNVSLSRYIQYAKVIGGKLNIYLE